MHWNNEYRSNKQLWGAGPSELAVAAVAYLQGSQYGSLSILDIGCGYGRDVFYYTANLRCRAIGIDISEQAIELASEAAINRPNSGEEFRRADFKDLGEGQYEVVSVSNFYQLLEKSDRKALRETIRSVLSPSGLLFLRTLSVNDPEHYGKGVPLEGEPNPFRDRAYLHLCTREELAADFSFLNIKELYEHEYDEPRATGETHHHISWILIGENAGASSGTPQPICRRTLSRPRRLAAVSWTGGRRRRRC